ncbi:uncharacterized protein LOC144158541 isoform X10 [Haemaphysalis longicornis]
MPLAVTLMPENFIMAVPTAAAHYRDVSCSSRGTQAAITFSAMGTQCALMCLSSTSSQAEEEFAVLEVNDATACDSRKFSVPQDGSNIVVKPGMVCSCCTHSGNTGQPHHSLLTKDDAPFQWTEKKKQCIFEKLKQALLTVPVLAHLH